MKIRSVLLPLFVLALLSSCATLTKVSSTSKSATSKVRYVTQTGIQETPLVTDLVVEDKKVTGSFSGTNTSEENAKNIAVYNALKNANAEVLVEPVYQIELKDYKDISVTVEGYPARYKNFRAPTHNDSIVLGLTPPRIDTVIIEKNTSEKGSNNCCGCCGNGSSAYFNKEINLASSPATATPKIDFKQPVGDKTPSVGDTDKFRQDYLEKYNYYLSKGKKQTGWGIGLLATGTVFMALSPTLKDDYQYYNNGNTPGSFTLIGLGGSLFVAGMPVLLSGMLKVLKAKKMRREAPGQGIQLAFHPVINPINRTYMAGISMNF